MLTAEECLAKAAEVQRLANSEPTLREHYLQMVKEWRALAVQAGWQDAADAHLDGSPAESEWPGALRH